MIFEDSRKARAWLEANLWADGPVCGHCGTANKATAIKTREGLYQCNACRKQFTVTIGTPLEHSHIPLNKWLFAAHLLRESAISTYELHRVLGVSYKTALLMTRRLSEAMRDGKFPIPHADAIDEVPKPAGPKR
jgi:transposase-like protein